MKEGAKIVSSKAFCPLNFHITGRNLGGLSCIAIMLSSRFILSVNNPILEKLNIGSGTFLEYLVYSYF